MSDIFISYARDDQDRARVLAEALQAQGWSVWWDPNIKPGQSFDQVIEHELDAAKCVVVLWSERSINREWVKNEAASAAERGVLVPALIHPIKVPLEFRRRQTADLVGFKGDPTHPGFEALCQGIAAVLGGAPPPQPNPRRRSPSTREKLKATAVGLSIILGLGAATLAFWPPDPDQVYAQLTQAQWEGIKLLDQGSPQAWKHIKTTLAKADKETRRFPQQARFQELRGYLLKDVYRSPAARQQLPRSELRWYLVQARKSAEEVLEVDPERASAHNLMGNVLLLEGNCASAVQAFDRALQLNQNQSHRTIIEGDREIALKCAQRKP